MKSLWDDTILIVLIEIIDPIQRQINKLAVMLYVDVSRTYI